MPWRASGKCARPSPLARGTICYQWIITNRHFWLTFRSLFPPLPLPEPQTLIVLPPAAGQGSQSDQTDEKGQSDQASEPATQEERPLVRPSLPDVAAEERLLRRTLPDAHLTIAQEAAPKARHGRYEVRTLWTLSSADLNAYAGSASTVGKPWPGLAQVSRIQRVICQRDRKTGRWNLSEEVAYGITSLPAERSA